VCSGIEAATVAWEPLGWRPWAFAEVDRFPSAVLAHHYPSVPNLGDMTRFQDWPDAAIDVLVGGTPCQSFSVAGLRTGLDDPRGGLLFAYLAIARRYRPHWVVWENVPGVLSIDDGRAFGSLLWGLAELGYGFAYRILDAQYFHLAQRRARVFVVGHLGDWRRAAAVLFERESLSGHPAPRREAGAGIANSLTDRPDRGGGNSEGQRLIANALRANSGRNQIEQTYVPIAFGGNNTSGPIDAATACNHHSGCYDFESETLVAFDWQSGGDSRGLDPKETAQLQRCQVPAVMFSETGQGWWTEGPAGLRADPGGMPENVIVGVDEEVSRPSVGDVGAKPTANSNAVRRLTPRECERLQGFPDDYTLIPYRGRPAADGPRYKALGNSMAVPVMAWIGRRIQIVDALMAA
jgi:DNA (cytosine-5)-methyltransferase 1